MDECLDEVNKSPAKEMFKSRKNSNYRCPSTEIEVLNKGRVNSNSMGAKPKTNRQINYNYTERMRKFKNDRGNGGPHDQISSKKSQNVNTGHTLIDHFSVERSQPVRRQMFPNIVFSKRDCFNSSLEKRNMKILNGMKELLKKESDEILLTILNDKSGFVLLLEQNIERDLMAYVLLVLGKAVSTCMSKHNSTVINKVTSSTKFLNTISKYLVSFQRKSSEKYHFDSLSSLIDFLNKSQMCLPSSASDLLLSLLPLLRKTCQMFLSNSTSYADILKDLDEIETRNTSFLETYSPSIVKSISQKEKMQLQEPPENYRSISIIPNTEDFRCESAFIRPNLVNGRYQDTEHYLDVQFRLLREDYVKPLRDGIAEYLNLKNNGKSTKQCKDVRVYENVYIISQQLSETGFFHIAHFTEEKFANIEWEYSKRFLTGSLLCLSNDNFETKLFASVVERKPEKLKEGKLMLRFEEMTDEVLNISPLTRFVVIETTSYFESYRHNLQALSELDERLLPMKRYIVNVEKTVLKPEYLNYETFYDMRPLLMPLDQKYINKKVNQTTYIYPDDINSHYEAVRVLDGNSWPSSTDFNLNPYQYDALKAAITKEFAVIQGPPGTGKTFIGLRIVQLILHNIDKWKTKNCLPILVVCQTNHALDQFLEGISMFTERIVRIGGGSKMEALEKFNLSNLKRNMKNNRSTPSYIYSSIQQEREDLRTLRSEIDRKNQLLEKSRHSILNQNEIRSYISDIHFNSLIENMGESSANIIMNWLEICPEDFDSSDDEYIAESDLWMDMNNREIDDIYLNNKNNLEIPTDYQILMNGKNYKREVMKYVSKIMRNCDSLRREEAKNINNVWEIDVFHRWKLYKNWIRHFIEEKEKEQFNITKKLRKPLSNKERKKLKENLDSINIFLKSPLSSLLDEHVLKKWISSVHFKSLRNFRFRVDDNSSIIYDWLELKCKNQNEIQSRIEVIEKLKVIDSYLKNSAGDGEYEDDIAHIEAQRNFDSEEFANISYNKPDESPSGKGKWKMQGGVKTLRRHIEKNLNIYTRMSEAVANRIQNVWNLSLSKKWQLYKFWLQNICETEQLKKYEKIRMFREKYKTFCELKSLEDIHVCKSALVIGMTTTGAAKYKHIIQPLNPVIVIVEEAAEILESHIVTSLAPDTQHVILIGDHQQLKPNPTVYMLSVKYDLDVSLFERMIKNGLPNHQLLIQHRMRPDISALIVPHIYSRLENHESVYLYKNINGVSKNVFFISHNYNELQENDSKSKLNRHEAQFLIRLCQYLCQNHDASQITVLTTYTRQLSELRKCASKEMTRSVRFAAVDNYQGEENDIILISFVRSNEDGEIGFLKISNRICVALSRAKKGLYCIGNFHLLAEKSKLWKQITNTLMEKNAIGTSLELVCQNHPDRINLVTTPEDFDKVPEGGCELNCDYRMLCGHKCYLRCHPYDKEHEDVTCYKPCAKTCEEGHPCKKLCHEECPPCVVTVSKIFEDCRHEITIKCHLKNKTTCFRPCERLLKCGHKCLKFCGESCLNKCKVLCAITSSVCNHEMSVQCFRVNDINFLADNCKVPCGVTLPCEHICEGSCGSCHQGELHIPCKQNCKKILSCGHKCQSLCYDECSQCEIPVIKKIESCGHEITVACYLKDKEVKCIEKCKKLLLCGHEAFTKCYLKVEEVKCLEKCKKMLPCGHEIIKTCYLSVENVKCVEMCKKTLLCGHEALVACYLELEKVKCSEMCKKTLLCGHEALVACYLELEKVKCSEMCNKVLLCGHEALIPCHLDIKQAKCNEICKKVLSCGHEVSVKCYFKVEEIKCTDQCKRLLSCGHICSNKCGDPCAKKCYETCLITSNFCGHDIMTKCFRADDGEYLTSKCTAPCETELPCKHVCKGRCNACHQGRFHVPCNQKCKRILVCGHKCKSNCSKSCPTCTRSCEKWCPHRKCSKKCSELCDNCQEPCTWICPHKRCTRLCWEQCDRTPCDEPCPKLLACQHPCIGFCGEPCPIQCRICNEYAKTGIVLDSNARYIMLEDCNHVYEVKDISQWMNENGSRNERIELIACPKCKTIVRRNCRFGNIIKKCLEDIEKAKKCISNENVEIRLKLLKKLKSSIPFFRIVDKKTLIFKQCVENVLKSMKHRTLQELLTMTNCLALIKTYMTAIAIIEKRSVSKLPSRINLRDSVRKLKQYAASADTWMSLFFQDDYLTASEQQFHEISWEIHRLKVASQLLQNQPNRTFAYFGVDRQTRSESEWDELILGIMTYSPFREQEFKTFCSKLKTISTKPGVNIKLNELVFQDKSVLFFLNQSAENFYKCSNGHVYRISLETDSSKNACKECKSF